VAEIGFTITSGRDPGCFEHVKTYIFHVPYALFRMLHANATNLRPTVGCIKVRCGAGWDAHLFHLTLGSSKRTCALSSVGFETSMPCQKRAALLAAPGLATDWAGAGGDSPNTQQGAEDVGGGASSVSVLVPQYRSVTESDGERFKDVPAMFRI
jgi:hypothetical protein